MEIDDDSELLNQDLTGTIFENISDLPIMSFIRQRLLRKQLTLPNKFKQEYYEFVIKRFNELMNIRPGSDSDLLLKIAIMEWNFMHSLKNVQVKNV